MKEIKFVYEGRTQVVFLTEHLVNRLLAHSVMDKPSAGVKVLHYEKINSYLMAKKVFDTLCYNHRVFIQELKSML